jgi:hypothetical protein
LFFRLHGHELSSTQACYAILLRLYALFTYLPFVLDKAVSATYIMIDSSHFHHEIGIFLQSIMICDLLSGAYSFMTTSYYPLNVVDSKGILLCLQHTAIASDVPEIC